MVGVGAWINGGLGGWGRWIGVCLDGGLDGWVGGCMVG